MSPRVSVLTISAIDYALGTGALCAWTGLAVGQTLSMPEPTIEHLDKVTITGTNISNVTAETGLPLQDITPT